MGKGDISFWRSNWLGEALNPLHPSKLTVRNGTSDSAMLQNMLSPENFNRVMAVVIDESKYDEMIFTPTASDKFHMKKYIEIYRSQRPKVPWVNVVWNSIVPNRINGLCGRFSRLRFLSMIGFKIEVWYLPQGVLAVRLGILSISTISLCNMTSLMQFGVTSQTSYIN